LERDVEKIAIVKCDCKHAFQDARYGAGNRVANYALKESDANNGAYRCTVCSKVHKK